MVLKYLSGEEVKKGDHVLFHGEPGRIEFVASHLGDPETDWFMREYGGGVMVLERETSRTFIPADQLDDEEDLKFVSRANSS